MLIDLCPPYCILITQSPPRSIPRHRFHLTPALLPSGDEWPYLVHELLMSAMIFFAYVQMTSRHDNAYTIGLCTL